jgi:hypothetical protein
MGVVYIDTGRYIGIWFGSFKEEDSMRLTARIWLLGTVACAVVAISAPAAQGAFGITPGHFAGGACADPTPNCGKPDLQAASSPFNTFVTLTLNQNGSKEVEGQVRRIRVDSPPGLIFDPHAIPTCELAKLAKLECSPTSIIGKAAGAEETAKGTDTPFEFPIFNVVPPAGAPSDFAYPTPKGIVQMVGGVSWHSEALKGDGVKTPTGDSHELFTIEGIPQSPPLVSLTIAFFGAPEEVTHAGAPNNAFIRIPTSCTGPATNYLEVESYEGESKGYGFTPVPPFTPIPLETMNCKAVPFPSSSFAVNPETTQSDAPDGAEVTISTPQDQEPSKLASSHLRTVKVTLPEGMTLNPSAAHGIEACTPEQVAITPAKPTNTCPLGSRIGTATVETPAVLAPKGLPAEHEGVLTGYIYLGKPATGLVEGPPYTIYVTAESGEYGVGLVQKGTVVPNEATGQLTTTFEENPQSPFSSFVMKFNGGVLAPLANPLVCGTATTAASLAPWSGNPASAFSPIFTVDANGKGGACPSPLPFVLSQSTEAHPTTGGANTNFTLNLARADGQQYLSKVSATLPPGLVGKIPAVPLCPEPQASQGTTCPSTSQIGTATVTVGSGGAPTQFSGPVYLTGPTGSAPYGMTTVINAAVGPFSLGNVIVRTGIEVDPITARVTVAGSVPTIFKGIPLRMKTLSVAINRQGFLINPTNCGVLSTNTLLTSSFGTAQSLSTPFQATGCSALAFKPKLTASSNAKTSRTSGASLVVKVGYPSGAQANIKSVLATVPKQLPSRLATLKNACLEKVFNANPFSCPSNSRVGGATVTTPVLPDKLTGPAFFVSHGGAAFPDLDLVMRGNGVTVILVGNTNISKGITTSNFAALPDVPVSSFELKLPVGPNSALAAPANLCKKALVMPTTITAQNGKVIKQNTPISVSGCPVTILAHHVRGNKAIVTVRVPAAGRVSGGGTNLKTVYRHTSKAQNVTLEVPLSGGGRPLAVRVRVGFIPKAKGASSVAFTTVLFK